MAELLIVVAIVAVLVAIAIPVFTSQLEKSREATDLANVRSAYAEVMAEVQTGAEVQSGSVVSRTVPLKQQVDGWQTDGDITIGGITHRKNAGDTDHWKGVPTSKGTCKVSYSVANGVVFKWGDASSASGGGSSSTSAHYFSQLKSALTDLDLEDIRENASKSGGFHAFLIQDGSVTSRCVSTIDDPNIAISGWPAGAVAAVFSHDGITFGFYNEDWSEQTSWTVGNEWTYE